MIYYFQRLNLEGVFTLFYVIIIGIIFAVLLSIYFINISITKVQLEELAHRHRKNDSSSGDLEEWEYYLSKLLSKPFGTRKIIDQYGESYEDYLHTNYPDHESKLRERYQRYKNNRKG